MTGPIDLTGAAPRWPDEPRVLWSQSMAKALREVDLSMRAPAGGDGLLREALAGHVSSAPHRLTISLGARAAAVPLTRGYAEVVVERPTFTGITAVLNRQGVPVRQRTWEDIPAAAAQGTAVWLTSPCRNPDGRTPDASMWQQLAGHLRDGQRVICDRAFTWFEPDQYVPAGIVQVGTLHKIAGPGAKLGWVEAADLPSETVAELGAGAPALLWQRTWGHFIADGGLADLLVRVSTLAAARRELLSVLGAVVHAGSGPNILLPVTGDETAALATLRRVGVLASPGSAFAALAPSVRVCLDGIEPRLAAEAAALINSAAVVSAGRAAPATVSPGSLV